MSTQSQRKPWESFSMTARASRSVEAGIVAEATRHGVSLCVFDPCDPDEGEDIVTVELHDDAIAGLMKACWRYCEMTDRDPFDLLAKAPGANLSDRIKERQPSAR